LRKSDRAETIIPLTATIAKMNAAFGSMSSATNKIWHRIGGGVRE